VEESFQDEFVAAMAIPHLLDDFSNLATVFELPARKKVNIESRVRKKKRRRQK
jgi:uncharacterized 2Fe-2S/4Fe-4S cluster protein (DUF4445 family)